MKMTKIALLASAALAAVSMSARADDLSDLKARIAALEANAAISSVPAGFQLMTVSKQAAIQIPGYDEKESRNYGKTATTIGIMPTADMPASTVIQWSGYVRAALVYQNNNYKTSSYDTLDILTRAEIKVVGKTDTAVGEVGATVKLRAQYGNTGVLNATGNKRSSGGYAEYGKPSFRMPGAFGYWKMTPELTLGAGLDGSLSGNGYGYDGACSCYYTDNAAASYGAPGGDPAQMRLSYASGPMSAAIAVEDYLNDYKGNSLGVSGEVKYAGDTVSGEVSGGYWAAPSNFTAPEDAYIIDAGLGFTLSDMFRLSASAGIGSGHLNGDDFYKANVLATVTLSDSISAELGYNYLHRQGTNPDQQAVLAGLYYSPVSQLVLGLEGEYISNYGSNFYDFETTRVDFVTKFSF